MSEWPATRGKSGPNRTGTEAVARKELVTVEKERANRQRVDNVPLQAQERRYRERIEEVEDQGGEEAVG